MRFRIFPILIVAIAVMLTVKVGGIWFGVSDLKKGDFIQKSTAQAQNVSDPEPPALGAPDDDNIDGFDFGDEEEGDDIPEGMLPADLVDDEEDFSDVSNLSSGEIRLLHDLSKRRNELDGMEKRLEEREALLRAAEQQLIEKQNSLTIIKSEIEALLAQYDQALSDENQRLINVYSNMKPKAAAGIFNDMDMDTSMILFRGMKERKLAPIMAAMDPEKVRVISKELASEKDLPEIPQ